MNDIDESLYSMQEYMYMLDEADKEKGPIGKIIDKSRSFIPRSIRFAKVKSVMALYLSKFDKRTDSLLSHFEKRTEDISVDVMKRYKKFKKNTLKPLVANEKIDQAVLRVSALKRDIETIKDNEMKHLRNAMDKIMDNYSSSIEKMIETPGFVSNVELSEKGKGILRAKWTEISSKRKMDAEEKVVKSLGIHGLDKIDSILSVLESFVEEYKYSFGRGAIEIYIYSVEELSQNQYKVSVFLRAPGRRYTLSEKGLLISNDMTKMGDTSKARLIKMKNLYFSSYDMVINAKPDDFIRPYIRLTDSAKPKMGDVEVISEMVQTSKSLLTKQDASDGDENVAQIPKFRPFLINN